MKLKVFKVFIAGLLVGAAGKYANGQSIEDVVLNVYKEPTCGCCNGWIEHMNDNGYSTAFHHPTNIQKLKDEFGLKKRVIVETRCVVFSNHPLLYNNLRR